MKIDMEQFAILKNVRTATLRELTVDRMSDIGSIWVEIPASMLDEPEMAMIWAATQKAGELVYDANMNMDEEGQEAMAAETVEQAAAILMGVLVFVDRLLPANVTATIFSAELGARGEEDEEDYVMTFTREGGEEEDEAG
jgi:hypothetical protein